MSERWDTVADWWLQSVRDDPANSDDFLTLLDELLADEDAAGQRVAGGRTLDVGCGEGQVMRTLGGEIVGTDISEPLLRIARAAGPVVRARLPDLSWVRSGSFDRAVCVGVIEAVPDHRHLFSELHRVVRPDGLVHLVANHPVTTAPGAQPMMDPRGESFWRWGQYLAHGEIEQEMGDHSVVLHHRPLGDLLTAAADTGWRLAQLIEHGPSAATRARYPDYFGHAHAPVLLGATWARGSLPIE